MKRERLYRAHWIKGVQCHHTRGVLEYHGPEESSEKESEYWLLYRRDVVGYDIFQFYWPEGSGSFGEPSLYLRFAALCDDDKAVLEGFFSEYGPLHLVGALRPDETHPTTTPDEVHAIRRAIRTFRSVLILAQAVRKKDKHLLKRVEGPLTVPYKGKWASLPVPSDLRTTPETIRTVLLRHLDGVTPTAKWDASTGRWVGEWTINSLLTGLYVMLHLDLIGAARHRQCPLEEFGCGTFFIGTRDSTRFCSSVCQERAKIRRHRHQQKQRGQENKSVRRGNARAGVKRKGD